MNHHDTNIAGMAFRCRADATLGFEFVDEGSRKVTGYDQAELVETGLINLPDLVQPAEREDVRKLIQDGINRRAPFVVRFGIYMKDRSMAEGILIGRGTFASPLTLTSIEGYMLRTLTSWEDTPETSGPVPGDLWQRMLDHTPDIIAYIGWDGIIRYITPSVTGILGYPKDQVTGTAFSMLLLPDERNRFDDLRQMVFATEHMESSASFYGMQAGGAPVQILILFRGSGEPDGSVILTARLVHDEKIPVAPVPDLLQAVCSASPVPLVITNKENRQILAGNKLFLALAGRSETGEVSGLSLTEAGLQVPMQDIILIEEILEHSGAYEGHETEIRSEAGSIHVLLSACTFDAPGQQVVTWSFVPVPGRRSDLNR
jgi:PAS domain-containing protein